MEGYKIKSALLPAMSLPRSNKLSAAAALNVMPANTSAVVSFSKVASIEAWHTKSPMGADPGFQSDAIAKAPPLSIIFLAGAKAQPSPTLAPGSATAMVFD